MRERPHRADETWTATWRRRSLTIPLVFVLALLALLLLPLTVVAAAAWAPFERRPWAKLRCVVFFTIYLVGEASFLTIAFGQWLLARGWTPTGAARLERLSKGLGDAWAWVLHSSGRLCFGLKFRVTGLETLDGAGPLITFWRHASMGDTPLAPVFLGRHAGLQLRYVAKSELRLDPIFDVIGGRTRSSFVRRGSGRAEREIAAVCSLLDDIGPRDAVVIFPEGTRFSSAKRARSVVQAQAHLPADLLERARAMRHVLPPRLGGPLALLERNPGADVLFCVHAGYEGIATFRDLLDGRVVGRQIEVHFERVPFAAIPQGREALATWLFDRWLELDRWIDARVEQPRADETVAHTPAVRSASTYSR